MNSNDIDFLESLERTNGRPLPDRERFTPSEKNKKFLQLCREKNYDISTIINMALDCFEPKSENNRYTWSGVDNVLKGKKKWF